MSSKSRRSKGRDFRRHLGTNEIETVPTALLDVVEVVSEHAAQVEDMTPDLEDALFERQLVSKQDGWPSVARAAQNQDDLGLRPLRATARPPRRSASASVRSSSRTPLRASVKVIRTFAPLPSGIVSPD
jgi:hypothetical protein